MRLLTWNIQWGRGMDGRVDLQRILSEIEAMGEFDVIALQEVAVNFPGLPGSRGEDEVALLAAGLPHHIPLYAIATDLPDDHGRRRQFGNVVFSRLPVQQVYRHLLPWPADPAVPSMQRVLLEAVLAGPFGPLRIMTTHLEYYSRIQREAQVDAIRRIHGEACAHARQPRPGEGEEGGTFEVWPRPASAILCGDMNFPAEAAERKRLLAPFGNGTPGFLDAWEVMHPGRPHPPTAGIHKVDWLDRPACYDFVFMTEDLAPHLVEYRVDAATSASDHQPVSITLS